jgi:AraC-like DNA-binding protein
MVRDVQVELVDDAPRPVIAVGNTYPDGHTIEPHTHRRGQLISGASGVLILGTPDGRWVMPPQRGMWIPPRTIHHVRMVGSVSVRSLYLEPEAAKVMPAICQVVGISTFMRSLMNEAVDLPATYDLSGRAGALMSLIQHELLCLPVLPLSLRFPSHGPLAERCRQFLRKPDAQETIDVWCAKLGLSRRSFTRLFRSETGMSFMGWRQQACLLAALPRLSLGESVTTVALDLGYDNPAAFTTMFKRILGAPPRTYLRQQDR